MGPLGYTPGAAKRTESWHLGGCTAGHPYLSLDVLKGRSPVPDRKLTRRRTIGLAAGMLALPALSGVLPDGVRAGGLPNHRLRRALHQDDASAVAEGALPGRLSSPDYGPFQQELAGFSADRIAQLDQIVPEASVDQLQHHLEQGDLTSADLVLYYLTRIRDLDDHGGLQSVVRINPLALVIAQELDADRAEGVTYGPLSGIPVLLKDNIATGDDMQTTAGAAALVDARADRDAFLVNQLRQGGAIVFGKTNMSEWAYWMSYYGPSGYSAVGGQTVSPYAPGIDPFGSSTGSAIAMTANLASLSIGTETLGSIVAPSSRASVVGMHPSIGLVSRDYVIPLAGDLDSPGPITRCVKDAAALLTVMAASADPNDPFVQAEPRIAEVAGTDFTAGLDATGLSGKRVGVFMSDGGNAFDGLWSMQLGDAAEALATAGCELVPVPIEFKPWVDMDNFLAAVSTEMGVEANVYLQQTGAPFSSLAEIVAFNNQDPNAYAHYGQEHLNDAAFYWQSYDEAQAYFAAQRTQAREAFDRVFSEYTLDILATEETLLTEAYSFAGCPAVTVPAGLTDGGVPHGITFVGPYLQDHAVLQMAYAFEMVSRLRVLPPPPYS